MTISSLVFSMDSQFLCASSNTETVHIFKLEHVTNRWVSTRHQICMDRGSRHKRSLLFLNAMHSAFLARSSPKGWCHARKHKIQATPLTSHPGSAPGCRALGDPGR